MLFIYLSAIENEDTRIPFVWIYRFVRALFVRRKHIKHEINAVNKIK